MNPVHALKPHFKIRLILPSHLRVGVLYSSLSVILRHYIRSYISPVADRPTFKNHAVLTHSVSQYVCDSVLRNVTINGGVSLVSQHLSMGFRAVAPFTLNLSSRYRCRLHVPTALTLRKESPVPIRWGGRVYPRPLLREENGHCPTRELNPRYSSS